MRKLILIAVGGLLAQLIGGSFERAHAAASTAVLLGIGIICAAVIVVVVVRDRHRCVDAGGVRGRSAESV